MYTYSWFTLLYSRNQHNIVNQLHANKNFLKISKWNWKLKMLKSYFRTIRLEKIKGIEIGKEGVKLFVGMWHDRIYRKSWRINTHKNTRTN